MVKGGCANPECKEWNRPRRKKYITYIECEGNWFGKLRDSKKPYSFALIAFNFCPFCGSPLTPPDIGGENETE